MRGVRAQDPGGRLDETEEERRQAPQAGLGSVEMVEQAFKVRGESMSRYKSTVQTFGKEMTQPNDGQWEPVSFVRRDATSMAVVWKSVEPSVDKLAFDKMKAERDELAARLRRTARILVERFGIDGPMNADDCAERAVKVADELQADLNERCITNHPEARLWVWNKDTEKNEPLVREALLKDVKRVNRRLRFERDKAHNMLERIETLMADEDRGICEYDPSKGEDLHDCIDRVLREYAEESSEPHSWSEADRLRKERDLAKLKIEDLCNQLESRNDAATKAFDEIAKLCGCEKWEYPGQIVRDVQKLARIRDEFSKLWDTSRTHLRFVRSQRDLLWEERDSARAECDRLREDCKELKYYETVKRMRPVVEAALAYDENRGGETLAALNCTCHAYRAGKTSDPAPEICPECSGDEDCHIDGCSRISPPDGAPERVWIDTIRGEVGLVVGTAWSTPCSHTNLHRPAATVPYTRTDVAEQAELDAAHDATETSLGRICSALGAEFEVTGDPTADVIDWLREDRRAAVRAALERAAERVCGLFEAERNGNWDGWIGDGADGSEAVGLTADEIHWYLRRAILEVE